jgi:hypothetical protein
MEFLTGLFRSGHIADIVLAVMVVEAFALRWFGRSPADRPTFKLIALALLPGCFLALALRAALTQAHWFWIAGALVGALLAHLADMRQRLQTRSMSSAN